MQKLKTIGPLFIIIAALLWSFDALLRTSLYSLHPTIVVFWEHFLGSLILTPFIIKQFSEIKKLRRKEWISIGIVSLFSGVLGTVLYTAALGKVAYIQFSVVVLLQQLQPIWAITAAAILLKEKISKEFMFWAAIAIIGSYFVTFKDLHANISPGNETLVAAIFALLAGMCWGISTSFSKIVLEKVSFMIGTYLRFILTAAITLIFVVFFQQFQNILSIDQTQWQAILIIVFSTGLVALLIYYYGLKRTPARVSAICELVWPASAILIDYFYFHKTLSVTQVIGVVVVLFSIYKISRYKK